MAATAETVQRKTHTGAGKFAPGNNANPSGRPRSSKHLLSEDFLRALHAHFVRHGIKAIARCAQKRPDAYLKVIAGILPRDLNVNVSVVQRIAAMSPEEIAALRSQVAQRRLALSGTPSEPADPSVVLDVPAEPVAIAK